MNSTLIFACFILYSLLLFVVTWITSKKADNNSFFVGNKSSKWYIVAYGMIGASLSGVTFMSVPGWVGSTQFSYMMVVFGYLVGYVIIATVLMPLYYKLNLTSIYGYLDKRFGFWSYKTGSFFFILSRVIGASFRMFLVVNVLQLFVFENWGIPFSITVLGFILLVLLYTYEGGIKTIVWTDTLQTTFMLLGIILTILFIKNDLAVSFKELIKTVANSEYSKVIFTDWNDKRFFIKQFLSGIFICVVMTGLDQEMMQKNLSLRTLKEAQKNMFSFSFVLMIVNFLFLFLGAILYLYAHQKNIAIPTKTDDLFPVIALQYLQPIAGVVFVIGLISAAYPSADGALTSLTTSFCVDFLNFEKNTVRSEKNQKNLRHIVHLSFAFILFLVIIIFKLINDQAVISKLFTVAGYTYGPLLGLYAFGLFSRRQVNDTLVPLVCVLSPVLCYFLSEYSPMLFNGYKFGFELLIVNGLITTLGLSMISKRSE